MSTSKYQTTPKGIDAFLKRAATSLNSSESNRNLRDTRATRSLRKFSIKEMCEFFGLERSALNHLLQREKAPRGEQVGREVHYSADDMMKLRLLDCVARKRNYGSQTIFWRKKGDFLPVIVCGSQKGGSGKSITACNLGLWAQLAYGLRVGIVDADPQATASLYFADDKVDVGSLDTQTFTNFMGMQEPGEPIVVHDPETLNSFWKETPWPGIRLLPGGPSIQEGDINLFFLHKNPDPNVPKLYDLLRSAIQRWDEAHPPTMRPEDVFDEEGNLVEEKYHQAMTETLDLIIIDCAPQLSTTMLNTIVAGTSIIVPSPLKGFDLSTARAYTTSAYDLISFLSEEEKLTFPPLPSFILPTIVSQQTSTDLMTLSSLMEQDPGIFCPVFYNRSEAVANAAEHYQSLYEFVPPKGKKRSTDNFLRNANAVGDAILSKCLPHLPPRGFANAFIEETYQGAIPPWNPEIIKEAAE